MSKLKSGTVEKHLSGHVRGVLVGGLGRAQPPLLKFYGKLGGAQPPLLLHKIAYNVNVCQLCDHQF